jgi:hypothetical protein
MRSTDFLAGLAPLAGIRPLEPGMCADKDALFDAEVSLPLAPGFSADGLRLAWARPAYSRDSRLLVVDVSRLSAP